MSATGYDAARAWLTVARSALERAAECAAAIEEHARAEYEAARDELEEMIRDAEFDLRMAEVIRARLERERSAA